MAGKKGAEDFYFLKRLVSVFPKRKLSLFLPRWHKIRLNKIMQKQGTLWIVKVLRTERIFVFLSCLIVFPGNCIKLRTSIQPRHKPYANGESDIPVRCILKQSFENFVFNLSYHLIYSASIRVTEVNVHWAASVVSRNLLRDLISWCKLVKAELCFAVISLPPAYITSFKTKLDVLQSIALVPRDIPFVW